MHEPIVISMLMTSNQPNSGSWSDVLLGGDAISCSTTYPLSNSHILKEEDLASTLRVRICHC